MVVVTPDGSTRAMVEPMSEADQIAPPPATAASR
jgi:hypothetical protein